MPGRASSVRQVVLSPSPLFVIANPDWRHRVVHDESWDSGRVYQFRIDQAPLPISVDLSLGGKPDCVAIRTLRQHHRPGGDRFSRPIQLETFMAVPLVLLKPQLSLVAMVVWALRSGWNHIAKASGLVVILNLPLFIWRPSLYRDFLWKSVSGQYLETQSLHVTAATSWLPLGSVIWIASSATLIAILFLLSLWARSERVTLLSTILADPVASGGEYTLLAVAVAMGHLDRRNLAVAAVTVFALPLLSIFVPRGDMLVPLATAILLGWAIYSSKMWPEHGN